MKNDYSFLKHNKALDMDETDQLIQEWQHNILNGEDLQVRLTDFVVWRYAPLEKDRKILSYVIRIQGYQSILITPTGSSIVCSYSPLAKTLIGTADPRSYAPYGKVSLLPLTQTTHHIDYWKRVNKLDALSDEHTKRLLMANCGEPYDLIFYKLCIRDRDRQWLRGIPLNTPEEDPILALVRYIRSNIPEPKRKILMDVFDTYGPTDTIVGDALIHLDKFRSF